jgi:hypothetical protein
MIIQNFETLKVKIQNPEKGHKKSNEMNVRNALIFPRRDLWRQFPLIKKRVKGLRWNRKLKEYGIIIFYSLLYWDMFLSMDYCSITIQFHFINGINEYFQKNQA